MKEQLTLDGSEFIEPSADDWETPEWLYARLNLEFQFTLDPCCEVGTQKCGGYFTPEEDGIYQSWDEERVFMNPPYSEIPTWLKKATLEVKHNHCELVVALLPAWTDRIWFHKYIYPDKAEVRFLQGRVKFLLYGREQRSPPFGSMVVIFK